MNNSIDRNCSQVSENLIKLLATRGAKRVYVRFKIYLEYLASFVNCQFSSHGNFIDSAWTVLRMWVQTVDTLPTFRYQLTIFNVYFGYRY